MRTASRLPFVAVVLVVASHCGGTAFQLDKDASTGESSSNATTSGGSTSSGASSSGSSGHGSGSSGHGSGSGSTTGSGTTTVSGTSITIGSTTTTSSTSSTMDAGRGDGGLCDCGTDPNCCTAEQMCCPGPLGGTFRCIAKNDAGKCPVVVSDRNLKRDIEPVDERAVLARLAALPVSSWSYRTDANAVRHMGPMAQDFHAAFGLGESDRYYDQVDAHGVAMAAIKALYEEMQEQRARIEELERDNAELRSQASPGNVCGR